MTHSVSRKHQWMEPDKHLNLWPPPTDVKFYHVDKLHFVYALTEMSCFHVLTLMTKTVMLANLSLIPSILFLWEHIQTWNYWIIF